MKSDLTTISKFLALVLRHKPEEIGLVLDANGWAHVSDLVKGIRARGATVNHETIQKIVAEDTKGRYALSDDGTMIRAVQGHSVEVDLRLEPAEPPALLYHGTVQAAVDPIFREGLRKMNRHHVHLSADVETATKVGSRRGKPVILVVDAARMAADGHAFYRSENGVWLTDTVPPIYISRQA